MADIVQIDTEMITLAQLLKGLDLIQTGGQAKYYLKDHQVIVDGEVETRRGRKLRAGTTLKIPDEGVDVVIETSQDA